MQRTITDRDTGQTALLLLSRATDWNQQLQEITYLIDRSDEQGHLQRAVLPAAFRFIFRNELHLLLKLGGFDLKDVYGSYALDPFEAGSDKLIALATPA